jgi:hypothetical protein
MAYGDPWTCLGEGAAHAAEIEEVELVWGGRFSSQAAIHRCRTCGQLYFYHYHEINDWSAAGEFCLETRSWLVLAPDEVEAARGDPNYRPRSGAVHNVESPWRRDG